MSTMIRPPEPVVASAAHTQSGQEVVSLADALDRILHRGVMVQGDLMISVAGVDLVYLDARLLLGSVDTIWPDGRPHIGELAPHSVSPPANAALPTPITAAPPPQVQAPPDGAPAPGATADISSALTRSKPKETPAEGLARLVLTVVNLLHEVLERQAVRRMTGGNLTDHQIEDVGAALYAQAEELERIRAHFGFSERDLALDLGRLDALS